MQNRFKNTNKRKERSHFTSIINPEIENSIQVLLKYREMAGVSVNNKYLFARTIFDSLSPIRSTDVLRKYAVAANLKTPRSITSTHVLNLENM